MAKRPEGTNWCFTINNPTEQDEKMLQAFVDSTDYFIVGREGKETPTPHLQGFFSLPKKKRLTAIAKLLPRAHLEIMMGTPQQASDYCKKEGDFHECGDLPLHLGQANKRNWDNIKAAAKEGRLDDIDASTFVQHYHSLKRIRQDYQRPAADADHLCGAWYYGPPGTGKSRTAREENPGAYIKPCNKWWDAYQGESCAIIDDLDQQHKCLGHYLKIWGDRYAFPAEHKGTTVNIRPEKVLVTSNYTPEELWPEDPILCEAIRRRYSFKHFNKLFI